MAHCGASLNPSGEFRVLTHTTDLCTNMWAEVPVARRIRLQRFRCRDLSFQAVLLAARHPAWLGTAARGSHLHPGSAGIDPPVPPHRSPSSFASQPVTINGVSVTTPWPASPYLGGMLMSASTFALILTRFTGACGSADSPNVSHTKVGAAAALTVTGKGGRRGAARPWPAVGHGAQPPAARSGGHHRSPAPGHEVCTATAARVTPPERELVSESLGGRPRQCQPHQCV